MATLRRISYCTRSTYTVGGRWNWVSSLELSGLESDILAGGQHGPTVEKGSNKAKRESNLDRRLDDWNTVGWLMRPQG
ncbi:hypothetical protein AVEN_110805-1 [Araneus ventricosus]|uniref:Uncharacterized protein n=1 Tax=Araneus ventricosus TaxID=182803 RepID=A0A4Y2GDA0_ARAVE|nr:hypothetical protein AVEN_110805-1 [Araneus ventricosus]